MLADILGYVSKSPTKIATLQIDIVRTIEYSFQQEVTSHPVETGFEIHDSIVNKPLTVDMTVGISSMPVTWFWRTGRGPVKFADGYKALKAIRDAKQPVTIVRPDRLLDDMVMTSCRLSKTDDSKSVMWVDLSFTHITKVTTKTTEIPEDIVDASIKDSAGETAADGGTATQTDLGSISSGSASVGDNLPAANDSVISGEAASNKRVSLGRQIQYYIMGK